MWLVWLLACPRAISPALQIEPAVLDVPAPPPSEPSARLAWMLAGDPLARRPRIAEDDPALAPFRDPSAAAASAADWWALERAHAGTLVVPLARGARLAVVETSLADPDVALDHAVPVSRPTIALPPGSRGPVDWVGGAQMLVPIVERSVLLGWLDGPAIDASAVSALLVLPEWARLADTDVGRLIAARAAGDTNGKAAGSGGALLADATVLALQAAAARTAGERTAAAAAQEAARVQLGTADPAIGAYLSLALVDLVRDAGADRSCGLALVSIAALRWGDRCTGGPCGGLDRVQSLNAAARWGAEPARLARLWQIIALDAARDHLDAAWTRATFPDALVSLVDVLVGLGDPAFDRSLLAKVQPDAAIALAVTRALGAPDATSREGVFAALDGAIRSRAQAAVPTATAAEGPFLVALGR